MNEYIEMGSAFYQANKEAVLVGVGILIAIVRYFWARIQGAAVAVKGWIFRPTPAIVGREADILANVAVARLYADDGILHHRQVSYYPDGTVKVHKMRYGEDKCYLVACAVELPSYVHKAIKVAYKARITDERERIKNELLAEAAAPEDKKWHALGKAAWNPQTWGDVASFGGIPVDMPKKA